MAIIFEAVYEDGVLKPEQSLPLKEHERVSVVIQQRASVAQATYGMLGWSGDAESADYFAMDPELDPLARPE